jgi:hypothetical protein
MAGMDSCAYAIEARAIGAHVNCEPAKRAIADTQRLLDEAKDAIAGIETGILTPAAALELCGDSAEVIVEDAPVTLRGEDLQA